MPEPVKIRHPPHTRRAAQYARGLAAERNAGRRRLVAVVLAILLGALIATRPVLLGVVVVAVALGLALRRTLLGCMPGSDPEPGFDQGSSRAPRRQQVPAAGGPPPVLILALTAAAVIAATLWVAHLDPLGPPAAFWSGFWADTGVERVLVAIAYWPPLRWIVWLGGLLFAGTIRRKLFERRVKTVAIGDVRDTDADS